MSIQKFVPTSGHGGMVAVVSNDYSNAYVQYEDYASLQAKLDAVAKDVERYRWLRGDGPLRFVTDFKPFVGKFTGSGFDGLMRDDADAAIDAAMAALTDQGRAGEGR